MNLDWLSSAVVRMVQLYLGRILDWCTLIFTSKGIAEIFMLRCIIISNHIAYLKANLLYFYFLQEFLRLHVFIVFWSTFEITVTYTNSMYNLTLKNTSCHCSEVLYSDSN